MKTNRRTPNTISRRHGRRRGFTLTEVLVVLFILLAIMSVMVGVFRGTQKNAQIDQTKLYIRTLVNAVELYELHIGRPPTTEQGLDALLNPPADLANPSKWGGPYLKDNAKTLDPWDSPYQYVSPGTKTRDGFDIWSFGPDGIDGTDDDIGNWTSQ